MQARTMGRGGALLGAAAALLLAGTAPAVAQDGERTVVISDLPLMEQTRIAAEIDARNTEASELLEEARAHEEEGEWGRAARRYERSGELRADGDGLAWQVYDMAGRAYYFSDSPGRASRMWEESAERALIFGNVLEAAHGYLRAAVAAQEAGKRVRTVELGWKAYHLSQSPALTRMQREELQAHLSVGEGDERG